MRASQRDALRRRYHFRCGYCGVREKDVGAQMTVDHFQPCSRGGLDEAENWVYSCHACNEFKSDYWEPDSPRRVLHPERDRLADHVVEESDGKLTALTVTGTFHIDWLHLNREQLVAYRQERRKLDDARRVEAGLLETLQSLDDEVRRLIAELEKLRSRRDA